MKSMEKDKTSTIAVNRYISQLKAFRTKADYDDARINEDESKSSSEAVEKIRELIIKIYGL